MPMGKPCHRLWPKATDCKQPRADIELAPTSLWLWNWWPSVLVFTLDTDFLQHNLLFQYIFICNKEKGTLIILVHKACRSHNLAVSHRWEGMRQTKPGTRGAVATAEWADFPRHSLTTPHGCRRNTIIPAFGPHPFSQIIFDQPQQGVVSNERLNSVQGNLSASAGS